MRAVPWIWLGAAALIIAIHCLTLRFSPMVLQDEVQVLDYGRTILQPDTRWAMSWNIADGRAVLLPFYPGIALQEWAYRAFQPSHIGPRLLSVLAAALAAGLLLGWLWARGTPRRAAALLALAFLVDPIFSFTYREARVDAWAFAACFAACWLLRAGPPAVSELPARRRNLTLAGGFAALAPFMWGAATVLLPLIFAEFVSGSLRRDTGPGPGSRWRGLLGEGAWLGLGGVAMVLVLAPPLVLHFDAYLSGLQAMAAIQARAAVIQQSIPDIFAVHDPLVLVVVLAAVTMRREVGLVLGLAVAVLMMYQTMIYPTRAMYLLPYALAMAGGACHAVAANPDARFRRALMRWTVSLLLVWDAAVVLGYRPVVAWLQQPANHLQPIVSGLRQTIGEGPHRVLLEAWQGYYAGRALGWQMYRPGSPTGQTDYRRFLKSIDYIVVQQRPLSQTTTRLAEELGFRREATLEFPQGLRRVMHFGAVKWVIPAQEYPTLVVYRNPDISPYFSARYSLHLWPNLQ